MKVLMKGTGVSAPAWSTQVSCSHCHALLEVEETDVSWKGNFIPGHSPDVKRELVGEHYQVTCPECRDDIVLVPPSKIRAKLRPWDV
jgi:hypothetical protein